MSIECLIFDLDDTIYAEYEFVFSGYKAVSDYLSNIHGVSIFDALKRRFIAGERGDLFSPTMKEIGIYESEAEVRSVLVPIYRNHFPQINPYLGFTRSIVFFKNWKLCLLTDGNPRTQRNKIAALGLSDLFEYTVVTGELGPGEGKPSGVGYELILTKLGLSAHQAIYIGDNAIKDFQYPKQIGMPCIRLLNNIENKFLIYENVEAKAKPDYECTCFDDLVELLRDEF